jgi:hypothetical protein
MEGLHVEIGRTTGFLDSHHSSQLVARDSRDQARILDVGDQFSDKFHVAVARPGVPEVSKQKRAHGAGIFGLFNVRFQIVFLRADLSQVLNLAASRSVFLIQAGGACVGRVQHHRVDAVSFGHRPGFKDFLV